jgi:hypothetical protein
MRFPTITRNRRLIGRPIQSRYPRHRFVQERNNLFEQVLATGHDAVGMLRAWDLAAHRGLGESGRELAGFVGRHQGVVTPRVRVRWPCCPTTVPDT